MKSYFRSAHARYVCLRFNDYFHPWQVGWKQLAGGFLYGLFNDAFIVHRLLEGQGRLGWIFCQCEGELIIRGRDKTFFLTAEDEPFEFFYFVLELIPVLLQLLVLLL